MPKLKASHRSRSDSYHRLPGWSLLLAFSLTLPVSADWIVTQNGERIETRGPWKVKGRLLVFETPKGELSSVRLSQVDLEASERVTAEAKKPQPEVQPAPAVTQPVLVLTDEDVTRSPQAEASASSTATPPTAAGSTAPEAQEQGSSAEGQDPAPAAGSTVRVRVSDWNKTYNGLENQLEITGVLLNDGETEATGFLVTVIAYDPEGALLGQFGASVVEGTLAPGETSDFRAILPSVEDIGAAKFEVRFRATRSSPETPATAATEPPGSP